MITITCQDNLELLKSLPDNHLDLIYCDILYATGKIFKDFADLPLDPQAIKIIIYQELLKCIGYLSLVVPYIYRWIQR